MSRIGGFRELLDLSLDIFPHVSMEFERKLAEGAGENSPFSQFGYGIVSRAPADRACKRKLFFFHGSIANEAKASFTCWECSKRMVCIPSF